MNTTAPTGIRLDLLETVTARLAWTVHHHEDGTVTIAVSCPVCGLTSTTTAPALTATVWETLAAAHLSCL